MINHIVLMKLNDAADEAVITGIRDYVAKIAQFDHVHAYAIVRNTAPTAIGFDWAILSAFDTEADIAAYRVHPLHR